MIIVTLRTDKPEAELALYDDEQQLAQRTWLAHRQLAETLHSTIEALLISQQKNWEDMQGIVCFQGPGSFTGLRIGLTVANALSESYHIPIVAEQGHSWLLTGIHRLMNGKTDELALPFYGADAHITQPKK